MNVLMVVDATSLLFYIKKWPISVEWFYFNEIIYLVWMFRQLKIFLYYMFPCHKNNYIHVVFKKVLTSRIDNK